MTKLFVILISIVWASLLFVSWSGSAQSPQQAPSAIAASQSGY